MMDKKRYKKSLLALMILLLAAGCSQDSTKDYSSPPAAARPIKPVSVRSEHVEPAIHSENIIQPADDEVLITAAGDIMVHESQWIAQSVGKDRYDFEDNFTEVRDFFIASDLSIANLETTINRNQPVSTYPRFNSPPELLDGIRYAGLNLIGTANNHSMDTGPDGIMGTIEELEKRNLEYVGTHRNPDSKKYLVKTIKGMKLGIASFSTAYFNSGGVVINNISSSGMENHVNYMELTNAERAFDRLKPVIDDMKGNGVEFIMLLLHWGNEYEKKANLYQKELAELLIEEGVDLILGSHPHMVQEMEFIQTADGQNEGLVVYSLGNFLSNQRDEILNMTGTEDGLISRVSLKRQADGKLVISRAQFIPTWVSRTGINDTYRYKIIPIGLDPVKTSLKYESDVISLTESLQNTLSVMNDSRITQFDFLR